MSVSLFRSLCHACELDIQSAAAFLDVRDDKIRKWWYGHSEPLPGVVADLAHYLKSGEVGNERRRMETMTEEQIVELVLGYKGPA